MFGLSRAERLEKQLKIHQLEADIEMAKIANKTFIDITEAQKKVTGDDDEYMWIQNGQVDSMSISIGNYDHNEMLNKAYKAWSQNLFARAIIRNLSKFVLGKGPKITPISENQKVRDYWDEFVIVNKWNLKEKELVRRVFRDGEIFIRKYPVDNTLLIRFIRAQRIMNPKDSQYKDISGLTLGIKTKPDDVETPLSYYLCDQEGSLKEVIKAEEIIHIKILVDSDEKRGVSFLLVALPMLAKYASWLEDRITLNKVRSAIALIRKVAGSASTVESIRDKYRSEYADSDRYKVQQPDRGTIITASKGIEYEMLSPNINATDVKDDGRAMLLAVAAGSGFPEMILTADYSNANYSSSMVAQNPFVREVEDWQDFFEHSYVKPIFAEVIRDGKRRGSLPEGESEECKVEWPPLIMADIEKNNKAREIQRRNKIISNRTWMTKEGLDPDQEEQQMEEEATKDVYKQPFNMPVAPTNQFGSSPEEDLEEL
jgi:capsid protein